MRMLRIVGLFVSALMLSGLASAADEAKMMPKNIPDFDVQGISMTECQCTAYACPCRSNGHPDHGSCDAADFTYIKHGHYGKVDMSGFKAVLIGEDGSVAAVGSSEYPFDVPQPLWSEQDPRLWWAAAPEAIRSVLTSAGVAGSEIVAVGTRPGFDRAHPIALPETGRLQPIAAFLAGRLADDLRVELDNDDPRPPEKISVLGDKLSIFGSLT